MSSLGNHENRENSAFEKMNTPQEREKLTRYARSWGASNPSDAVQDANLSVLEKYGRDDATPGAIARSVRNKAIDQSRKDNTTTGKSLRSLEQMQATGSLSGIPDYTYDPAKVAEIKETFEETRQLITSTPLSPREREALLRAYAGETPNQIAEHMAHTSYQAAKDLKGRAQEKMREAKKTRDAQHH